MSLTWLALLAVTLPIPWIAKLIFPHEVKFKEMGITVLASTLVMVIIFFAGIAGKTWDKETWNGQITSKDRKHDSYIQSYDCFCTTDSKGNRTCQTCYETHYTVTWKAYSNIGNFVIEHLDSTSRRVYDKPDPARYTVIQMGDPCSISTHFTNYVKAVPESLFHQNVLLSQKYASMIPEYPGQIYDHYKIDRVIPVGVNVPELDKWNHELSLTLRQLGPMKQANAIIIFVNTSDQQYMQALESAWIGGKKNDIIVIVGVRQWPNIEWVGVSSWTKSEIFKVQLRDDLLAMKTVDRTQFIGLLNSHTMKSFYRRNMEEFKYLEDEIEPPMWVVIMAALFGISISLGASYYFWREDPFEQHGYGRYR